MSFISAHALDSTLGTPAADLEVTLYSGAEVIANARTDGNGRVSEFGPDHLGAGLRVEQRQPRAPLDVAHEGGAELRFSQGRQDFLGNAAREENTAARHEDHRHVAGDAAEIGGK